MDVFEVARPRATCLLVYVEPAGDALLSQKIDVTLAIRFAVDHLHPFGN